MIVPTCCQNLVKIGPAVFEISRGQISLRTNEQTDGRHRKLIVDYPQATFNSTKVIWSKSVQPFPRYRVVARGCPWLHVRPKRTYVVLTHRNLITGNLMTIPTYRENFIKIS